MDGRAGGRRNREGGRRRSWAPRQGGVAAGSGREGRRRGAAGRGDIAAIWRAGSNLPSQNLAGTRHPVAAVVYWDDPYNGEFAVDLASHNEPLLSSRKMTATLASSFSRLWVSRLLDGSFICVVHPQMVISNG